MDRLAGIPELLVIGHGHGGGSVAAAAAGLGIPTTIWGRRELAEANPCLHRHLIEPNSQISFERVDVDTRPPGELAGRLRRFDWVVLAHEARALEMSSEGIQGVLDGATRLYGALEVAGFGTDRLESIPRRIVRLGSPAAEAPVPEVAPRLADHAYSRIKAELRGLAEAQASGGLPVLTVAPAEIHSPWSGYGSTDPYRISLDRLGAMSVLHDFPTAAVSDVTAGRAVLLAAGVGDPGAWYQVADGVFGPGRAVEMMAGFRGQSSPPVATWQPQATLQLLDFLELGRAPDLEVLREATTGLDAQLSAAQSVQRLQQGLTTAALWWAGSQARQTGRRIGAELSAGAVASILRSMGEGLAPAVVALLLGMGLDRPSKELEALEPALRHRAPGWVDFLTPLTSPDLRRERLVDSVGRQSQAMTEPADPSLRPTGPDAPIPPS